MPNWDNIIKSWGSRFYPVPATRKDSQITSTHDVLKTAQSLATGKYNGWTYGKNASNKQIDCVQFILAVVEEELKRSLNTELKKVILIDTKFDDLETAILSGDKRTRGVQYALVDLMDEGVVVFPDEAKPGDIIQYWMKKNNGEWFGRAGVISRIWKDNSGNPRSAIFGAHNSMGKIGETDFEGKGLNLKGENRKIYIVRLK